ncbi:MAG: hypothetical protein R2779_05985 [Crocinitomicaceae bacterium]
MQKVEVPELKSEVATSEPTEDTATAKLLNRKLNNNSNEANDEQKKNQ